MSSLPPETEDIDASWDDEPFGLELDGGDPFDRETVVPDEPVEQFAARQMAENTSVPPKPASEFPVPSSDFEPDSFPPLPMEPGAGRFSDPAPERLSPATPIPARRAPSDVFSPRNSKTNPEPLRPRTPQLAPDFAEAPDSFGSLPPIAHDFDPTAEDGDDTGGPSIPRSAVQPSGLELDDFKLDSGAPPSGSALDLVSRPREPMTEQKPYVAQSLGAEPSSPAHSTPTERSESPVVDMKDRYAVGDFTGALVIAESILESDPDHADARRYADSCREVLTQMYAARLGQLDQVVAVAVPPDQIRWLSLDHRAGFLLSLVDGMTSIEEILDVSGMTRLDALRIMFTLVQQRVIALEPGR
ncbi:MAG: hypothetical protein H6718_13595 [Polyangiaceae bacterium]|nr:hypothetical protein [Polyangiaceae bacterium]MCB9605937.1 hypothetical protein [Polyangiaceae bacterium]